MRIKIGAILVISPMRDEDTPIEETIDPNERSGRVTEKFHQDLTGSRSQLLKIERQDFPKLDFSGT